MLCIEYNHGQVNNSRYEESFEDYIFTQSDILSVFLFLKPEFCVLN